MLLMALVLQLGTIQGQLFQQSITQKFLVERVDDLHRIMEATRREQPGLIQSAVRTEVRIWTFLNALVSVSVFFVNSFRYIMLQMQEIRAAPLSDGVHHHPGNPTIRRPQCNVVKAIPEGLEQTGGRDRMVQLRFVNNSPKSPLYTGLNVKWQNRTNVKVAIFENDNQITQGDISKVKVDILAVRSEFFTRREENFTKEEFNRQICISGDKELVLATANLVNGECYLDSFCFTESSHRKKWRLAARVNSQVPGVRFQEAVTGPFVVKDRRSKSNAKSYPPRKEDDVHRLEKISPKGKFRNNLVGEGITKVKQLLRRYHVDASSLQELIGMKNETWKVMIKHAKKCDPGKELYAYNAMEENCILFFNDLYDLVGMELDGTYTPYGNLDQSQQDKVNKYKMAAHKIFDALEKSGSLNHDYEMINDYPSLVRNNPSTQAALTSQQYSHHQNQGFDHCQPSPQQNGLSAPIFQNNATIPSAQETLASETFYGQNVDKDGVSLWNSPNEDMQIDFSELFSIDWVETNHGHVPNQGLLPHNNETATSNNQFHGHEYDGGNWQ
ncbi:hypothetical protein ABZP36_018379 [Zizania latifolia]